MPDATLTGLKQKLGKWLHIGAFSSAFDQGSHYIQFLWDRKFKYFYKHKGARSIPRHDPSSFQQDKAIGQAQDLSLANKNLSPKIMNLNHVIQGIQK